MADTESIPSPDRDIEFCEKAINAGYIVKEIVPSILRKLNEKRISGVQSSIGQELIALDLMTHEQVKEILLLLENVELTCENCGKKYVIRAYDPGRQYACKECGAYLEPADADLRMLKYNQAIEDSDPDSRSSSTSVGDPNPQLANLLPPEDTDEIDRENDPILAGASPGSLKNRGVVGKNVFSLDDDMLGEVQKSENDDLNRMLGIDDDTAKFKPVEKPSFARERKLAAQKKEEETKRKSVSERRQLQRGGILKEIENDVDELDSIAEQSEKLGTLTPGKSYNADAILDEDFDDLGESDNKLMNQSAFLRMIDPEAKKKVKLKEAVAEDDKLKEKLEKKEKKKKIKEQKIEKPEKDYKKYKQSYSSSSDKKGVDYISIILIVLFLVSLISALMMFKLWTDKESELENLRKDLQKANNTIREQYDTIFKSAHQKPTDNVSLNIQDGMKRLIIYENDYSLNPVPSNAKKIAQLIKENILILDDLFAVDVAEFLQKTGASKDAILLLIDKLTENKELTTSTKVRLILKIAEICIMDLAIQPDLKLAQEYIDKASLYEDLTNEETQLIDVWKKVLKGQHHPVLKFNIRYSYEHNLTYLVEKFAGFIPSLKGKFKTLNKSSEAVKSLDKALLLYEHYYSIELLGCLNIYASGNKKETVNQFFSFQKRFGKSVYLQKLLWQLYVDLKDFEEAEKILTWLINNKKELTDSEKRRDDDYRDLLSNRANISIENGNYNSAIGDLNDLIELYPVDAVKFRIRLGKVYLLIGKNFEASEQFSRAYEYNKALEIRKLLIKSYIEFGSLDSARKMLDELKDNPQYKNDCDIKVLQGLFYMKKSPRDVDAAMEEFESALKIDEYHIDALYYQTRLNFERNYITSAKEAIEKLEKIDESLWQLYFLKGIYAVKNNTEDANSYFELAKEAAPPAMHEEIGSYMK